MTSRVHRDAHFMAILMLYGTIYQMVQLKNKHVYRASCNSKLSPI